jgi:hypothetical protein
MRIKGVPGHDECTDAGCTNGAWSCFTTDKCYTADAGCVTDVEYKCGELPDPRKGSGWWMYEPYHRPAKADRELGVIFPEGYNIEMIITESRSRFKEEVVKALEGSPSHIQEPASSDGVFYDERSFNAGYRLAKQEAIETIKKL